MNLGVLGLSQRTPVVCVLACVFLCMHVYELGTISALQQSLQGVCSIGLYACAHIWHVDAARATVLSPIMLLSCPMV